MAMSPYKTLSRVRDLDLGKCILNFDENVELKTRANVE